MEDSIICLTFTKLNGQARSSNHIEEEIGYSPKEGGSGW